MLDINIEYFNTKIEKNKLEETCDYTIVFSPKEIIKDIIWDFSNTIIPFSNGKRYYVYQDIVFNIIDFYENTKYSYISISISKNKTCHDIILNNIKNEDYKYIIKMTTDIITKYINKKFGLWC